MSVTHLHRRFIGNNRLANVCWQIGATIAYARKHNMDYFSPKDEYSHYFSNLKVGMPVSKWPVHKEKIPYKFEEIPAYENVTLQGWWQAHAYIEPVLGELRELFEINDFTFSGKCSIHVRRGDYVQYSEQFPPITMEYIEKAITKVADETGVRDFVVYSDDIEWCKKHITYERFNRCNVLFREGFSDIEDLRHMSHCEHNIICNSSYSLLASILNTNKHKLVVSPHHTQWVGKSTGYDCSDVIPPSFHQIMI